MHAILIAVFALVFVWLLYRSIIWFFSTVFVDEVDEVAVGSVVGASVDDVIAETIIATEFVEEVEQTTDYMEDC